METVTISSKAYRQLCEWKRDYDALRKQRDDEAESWDRMYNTRQGSWCFLIRTRDGFICYVPIGLTGIQTSRLPDGRRQLIRQVQDPHDKRLTQDPAELLLREVRWYVETDERIMGVPVFQETVR